MVTLATKDIQGNVDLMHQVSFSNFIIYLFLLTLVQYRGHPSKRGRGTSERMGNRGSFE